MKPTFQKEHPILTDMIIVETAAECIVHARMGLYDGAEAFGLQMERLNHDARTPEALRKMFEYMEGKPIYVTNYRGGQNQGMTEEERMEELKRALLCGATLIDIPADTFDPTPGELTNNPAAVGRQRRLIDEIHEAGGEVLMSSHVFKYQPYEKVLDILSAQQERGADVVKIVTGSSTEDELWSNLEITRRLKQDLRVPYLFLSGGAYCKLHRAIGPYLGCCMWLCVDAYDTYSSKEQPLLRAMSSVRRNLELTPNVR